MVTPTAPPMPKIPLISVSKREKNSHDNQGELHFLRLTYKLYILHTFFQREDDFLFLL